MKPKRLLIECTYVFEHPKDNSGIQRVVRNIIKNIDFLSEKTECIPVIFLNNQIYRVLSLCPIDPPVNNVLNKINYVRLKLDKLHVVYWGWYHFFCGKFSIFRLGFFKKLLHIFFKVGSYIYYFPRRAVEFSRFVEVNTERAVPILVDEADCLVLLDSSWHSDYFSVVESIKKKGVSVVSVIYDLIPLTHPVFCDSSLVKVFDAWFEWLVHAADGFVCISKTIMTELEESVNKKLGPDQSMLKWYRYFHLGSDLDLLTEQKMLDVKIETAFSGHMSAYIMVSTIEPRKNHAYLLNAFELLWQKNIDAKLIIIGKVGWKCEQLINRIESHPELNQRLYMFNHASDNDLAYAYTKAKCLLFPSYVEGFGLPIVEAMQKGLPVMVSNIPVFHEIGGEKAAYFDLDNCESLCELITNHEKTGIFPSKNPNSDWQWMGWRESTDSFIKVILSALQSRA